MVKFVTSFYSTSPFNISPYTINISVTNKCFWFIFKMVERIYHMWAVVQICPINKWTVDHVMTGDATMAITNL